MKKTERKVRDEISEIVINHNSKEGKGHIGKVFVEVYKYGYELWINCVYNDVSVCLITDSKYVVRRFIVSSIRKGLTKLRWLLEKLKDKDN